MPRSRWGPRAHLQRLGDRLAHRDDRCRRLARRECRPLTLRQRLRGGLRATERDGPAVIDDDEHHRRCRAPARLIASYAPRRAAIANVPARSAVASISERHGGPGRVQGLGGDRHAPGKVAAWNAKSLPRSSPAQYRDFAHGHAAPQLRADFAVQRQHLRHMAAPTPTCVAVSQT